MVVLNPHLWCVLGHRNLRREAGGNLIADEGGNARILQRVLELRHLDQIRRAKDSFHSEFGLMF